MEQLTETVEHPYWLYVKDFWPRQWEGLTSFNRLYEESKAHLKQEQIVVYGQSITERRLTCLWSHENAVMKYSGRQVHPVKPPKGSYIELVLKAVNSPDFITEQIAMFPQLKAVFDSMLSASRDGKLFNACFMNLYRSPKETEKIDYLGPHSDDERSLTSPVILSITFCEEHGAKLFKFHEKGTEKVIWEKELEDGSGLWMLAGCQDKYKHSVSDRKTSLDRMPILGRRLNLTLRQIEVTK